MNHNKHYRSISFGEDVLKGLINASLFATPVNMENNIVAFRTEFEKIVKTAHYFPDFMNLPPTLQRTLLKHNASLIISLVSSLCTIVDEKLFTDILVDSLSISDVAVLKSLMTSMVEFQGGADHNLKQITYETRTHGFNFNDVNIKNRHEVLESNVGAKVACDSNLLKLLSYILLFCSDFSDEDINVESRDTVQNIQEKLVVLLQGYMYANISEIEPSLRFAQIMECLVELRELSEITNNIGF